MKKILLVFIAICGVIPLAQSKTQTEDNRCFSGDKANMRDLSTGNPGLISLVCSNTEKLDLPYLENLQNLNCSNNQLTELDFTNNTRLSNLYCDNNQLKKLDFTNYTRLSNLNCSNNRLTELDSTNYTRLSNLYCDNNQLKKLDFTNYTRLSSLNCSNNRLTELDFTNYTRLSNLYCDNNQLKKLDITKNTNLSELHCNHNNFKFSTLKTLVAYSVDLYNTSQSIIQGQDVTSGQIIDLADEYYMDGSTTTYKWYNIRGHEKIINMGSLSAGVYAVKMTTTSGIMTSHRVKKN